MNTLESSSFMYSLMSLNIGGWLFNETPTWMLFQCWLFCTKEGE
jgi:hypothetical protein